MHYMLHNDGNTILYYGEDFSSHVTSPTHKTILNYIVLFVIFENKNLRKNCVKIIYFYFFDILDLKWYKTRI